MTQQNNWQQGVWGDPNAGNAYQQTYNTPPGTQPSASGAQPAAAAPSPGAQPAAAAPSAQPGGAWQQPQAAGWQQLQDAPRQSQQEGQPAYAYVCAQPAYAQAPAGPAAPAPKKGKGWIVALVAVILFFALMFFGMASCNATLGSVMNPFGTLAEDSMGGVTTSDSIGVIELGGTIQYDGTTCSPEGLKEQLDIAERDPLIKAVVLRVNSGGGVATAGEEMSTYIREFSKPVVVSSASMNASAAYEISSQADYIFTAKTTAIGAIGTVMQVTDISGLLDKLGISIENLTSADSKDSSYGTRALTEEERAYYLHQIEQINESFIQAVAEGRNMSVEEVRALATGLTFTGTDAVENGLADEVGTLEDAIMKAQELAGCTACDVVYLQPGTDDLSELLGLMGYGSGTDLGSLLKELESNVRFEG